MTKPIGAIGFEGRWDYGAIGTVANLAARLCGEAKGGQILVSFRVAGEVEDLPLPNLCGDEAVRSAPWGAPFVAPPAGPAVFAN